MNDDMQVIAEVSDILRWAKSKGTQPEYFPPSDFDKLKKLAQVASVVIPKLGICAQGVAYTLGLVMTAYVLGREERGSYEERARILGSILGGVQVPPTEGCTEPESDAREQG